MFCKNCGAQITDDAKFCPSCGTKVELSSTPSKQINEGNADQKAIGSTKKKRGCGCYIAIFIVLIFAGSLIYSLGMAFSQGSSELTSKQWLEFDDRTWDDYVQLYNNHNTFMSALTYYSEGRIDAVSFYSTCQEAEQVFQQCSTTYDYGINKDQQDYLSPFEAASLADQRAAQSLLKYLDSYQTSDLASAQSEIETATQALTTIASNRGALLAKTDLTDEEIHQRIEDSMAALEQ